MTLTTDRALTGVHPERLRAVLDPRLSEATLARLMDCGRLRGRLDARLGRAGEALPDEAAWLTADPDEAACRAGALLHGQAVRAVLSGPAVTDLVTAIGREAHVLALRYGAQMPPRSHGEDLAEAILRDGELCLGAWLMRQDGALRRAVLLALPPGTPIEAGPFTPDLEEGAGAIMALVARSFGQGETGGVHG